MKGYNSKPALAIVK